MKTLLQYLKALKKRAGAKVKPIGKLQRIHKSVIWMELFSPNILVNSSKVSGEVPSDFNIEYLKFLESTSNVFAMEYLEAQFTIFSGF